MNLALKEGSLTSMEQPFGDEHYVLHRANPAFDFFWHTCLSITAMSMAISSLHGVPVNPGDYINLSCVGFDYTIRLPSHSSVDDVLHGNRIAGFVFTLHWGRDLNAQANWPSELRRWLEMTLWPGFVHLYEMHYSAILKKGGEAGELARLLRDAYAHGGKVANGRSKLEASWEGVTIRKADDGEDISKFVGGADLALLALKLASVI
ncbi:hypothetical protein [Frateuria terrea]|uniref:hypothetical protein n=1 Tax=Frateuria terrea TaxID=529704 RepID=UPI0015873AD8|nr:hypothetical protein [Frateuria terrea]